MPLSFFNWNILHFLFDEIFVRSYYAFKPPRDLEVEEYRANARALAGRFAADISATLGRTLIR